MRFGRYGRIGDNTALLALVVYLIYLNGFADAWLAIVIIFAAGTVLNIIEGRIKTGKWY